jgi:hypothetical protein
VYKETIGRAVEPFLEINVDEGYRGIEKIYENRLTPKKARKHHKLS